MSTNSQRKIDIQIIKLLLTPSWLSGLIDVVGGLVVVIGVVFVFALSTNQFNLQLLRLDNTPSSSVITLPSQVESSNVNTSLSTTWPLLVFWGIIGLVAYFFVENIVNTYRQINEFGKELNYVNAKRDLIIKMAVENLLLRTVSALGWLVFLNVFLKIIIPFAITESHLWVTHIKSINGLLDGFKAFIIMVVSLHLNTVFLRLIFKKPRLFTQAYYLE